MEVKFGLIGYPLGHSFSARYFSEKFEREGLINHSYLLFELETIDMLPDLLKANPELRGLNVTIPYKSQVFKYLDEVSHEASNIGAVNCIKISEGKLFGYNTDVEGVRESLKLLHIDENVKALILGTGGASKSVQYALAELGVEFLLVSRDKTKGNIAYNEIDANIIDSVDLIINTTPIGTYPNVEEAPDIPYELLSPKHALFDVVYNPAKTKFMQLGEKQGAVTINGLLMLETQAIEAWKIWSQC